MPSKLIDLTENWQTLQLPVHRIIPFSNVEGAGNRTSVFLQGCNLNCLYCHNPETIARHNPQVTLMTLQALYERIMQSTPFIRGVTFSGGEPTLHAAKLVPLFSKLRQNGLSCYLDTNGFFDAGKIQPLIKVTDKFLFDIKGIGCGLRTLCFDRHNQSGAFYITPHHRISDAFLNRHLHNLALLLVQDKIEEIRLVWIKDFFDVKQLIQKIAQFPNANKVLFKLIKVHAKGVRDEQGLKAHIPTQAEILALADYAKTCGLVKQKVIF